MHYPAFIIFIKNFLNSNVFVIKKLYSKTFTATTTSACIRVIKIKPFAI